MSINKNTGFGISSGVYFDPTNPNDMLLIRSHELLREYNQTIQELNSNPTRPDYKSKVLKAKEEFNIKLRKVLGELPAMHFPKEDT